MKKIIVLGGGTFSYVRNHLAICAPAFGDTARTIHSILGGLANNAHLVLTKMADTTSNLVTNEDVEKYIDTLLEDQEVGTIILNVAFADFSGQIGNTESGKHAERLKTSAGEHWVRLVPQAKVISKIKEKRPDIFLVGFKTTTNKEVQEQFDIGTEMLKKSKCNLVLANDTVTRNNIIVTPENEFFGFTKNRNTVLRELCETIRKVVVESLEK